MSEHDEREVTGQAPVAERARLAGRYDIVGLIGRGGMGSVYRAHDRELDEIVALKMLRGDLVTSEEMLARFRQEVKLARRVTHRNVARTFDIGEHAGEKFLTMEYVDGESLAARLEHRGALGIGEAVAIASEICAGLSAAHAAGIIHRDLKPDNVLLAKDGRVVLTDFGIARLVAPDASAFATAGSVIGTPTYMAPEQVEGGAIDARADVYAVGEILFEMLAGTPPWTGGSVIQVAAARLHHAPPDLGAVRPDLPSALSSAVSRAMARRPDDRFRTIEDLASVLGSLTLPLGDPSIAPHPPSTRAIVAPSDDATSVGEKTVAVLVWKSVGSPDDAYLAEGLTEDLIDSLSAVPGVRVRPYGTVLKYRDAEDTGAVGAALGVQVVAQGSVRRVGDKLRVSARLVSVADGFQLWAGRFDRDVSEFLAVSDEIADAIGAALLVDRKPQAREAPTNPAALELYLRARHEVQTDFRDGARRAVGLLSEALRIAPRDPLILSGFALVQVREIMFGENTDAAESVARATIEEAVRIAPQMAEPHLAMAALDFSVGEAEAAARSLARSFSLGRPTADAHDLMAHTLVETGPLPIGVRHLELALALEPRFHHTRAELVRFWSILGDEERSKSFLVAAPEEAMSAVGFWISRIRHLAWKRDVETARSLLRFPTVRDQVPVRALLDVVLDKRVSHTVEATLTQRVSGGARARRRRALFGLMRAEVHAYVGDDATTLTALEDVDRAGGLDVTWFEHCPLVAHLRGEPRFEGVRARVAERAARVRAALNVGTP